MTLFDHTAAEPGAERGGQAQLRLVVAYDGSGFHGFAESRDVRSVAGTLLGAIESVTGDRPDLTVAGRTDKGVHAWGNVVSFALAPGVDPDRLADSLNSMLGPEIVVRSADIVASDFDARRQAQWRRYRYTIVNRSVPDPFRSRFAWWVEHSLDVRSMRAAADPFIGTHDFASFCRRGPEGSSTTRHVLDSSWHDDGDGILVYEIRATAFCWQMVRSVVGTLVEVGSGKKTPGEVLAIIRTKDRSTAGQLAPPEGLCLWDVGY